VANELNAGVVRLRSVSYGGQVVPGYNLNMLYGQRLYFMRKDFSGKEYLPEKDEHHQADLNRNSAAFLRRAFLKIDIPPAPPMP